MDHYVSCKRACCIGKRRGPLTSLYQEFLVKSPRFSDKLRKSVQIADDPENKGDIVDITSKVYAEFYKDDNFRSSDVGCALWGRGSTIVLGPDPKLFLTSKDKKLRLVFLSAWHAEVCASYSGC